MNTVIIIGAGAAGMMAAISACQEGARVLLIEHTAQMGKKILSTGNGRCNFTNMQQEPCDYRSDNAAFPWKIIQKFHAQDAIAFFLRLGIYSKNRNGYLYPYSDQASSIQQALQLKIAELGVECFLSEEVNSIVRRKDGFLVRTTDHTFSGTALILATGSRAFPSSGSDGSGYTLAKDLGHSIVPVLPALTGLQCREKVYKTIAGIRITGTVSLFCNQQCMAKDTGEIQLTKYGISGIPIFQVSRYAARGLYEGQQVSAEIDFFPDFTAEQFFSFLSHRIEMNPDYLVADFFNGLFPARLSAAWIRMAKIEQSRRVSSLTERELWNLIHLIKEFKTTITEVNDYSQAQICTGGVDTTELNPDTLESRLVPGLFFAGEVLDVDGICGGYNLQWAWSSGAVAGKEAAHA